MKYKKMTVWSGGSENTKTAKTNAILEGKSSGSSFVDTLKSEVSPVSKTTLADGTQVVDKVKTGTKVAGWALSLVANGFSNYDEYGGFTGRMAAKATGAATTAKNAVSSWFSKVSNPVSNSNVQYSGD